MRPSSQRLPAWLLATALSLALGPQATAAAPIQRRDAPRPLPAIAFETRDGQTLTPAAFAGKAMVLHVWATWCGSCRTEFPSLLKFQDTFTQRGGVLVTVSIDRLGWPIIDRTLKELDTAALPVFLDRRREIPAALDAFGLPFSIIVDRRGREIARIVGAAAWDDPAIEALIDAALTAE